MGKHLRANLWLLVLTVLLCSVLYPLVILGIGQTLFHNKAQGSLLTDVRKAKPVGSRLIAQPFTADEYFQPRPSAASYNAMPPPALPTWRAIITCFATAWRASSAQSSNMPAARRRVSLSHLTSKVGSRRTSFDGKPGIVAQWASLHSGVAGPWLHDWVKADKLNAAYVAAWEAANPDDVAKWKSDNTTIPIRSPRTWRQASQARFSPSFSKDHPGTFPGVAEYEKDGKTAKTIGPVKEGSDIQSLFFDMWLQENPDADLERVPGDMVTTSGSGLDPDITLEQRALATGQSRRCRLG